MIYPFREKIKRKDDFYHSFYKSPHHQWILKSKQFSRIFDVLNQSIKKNQSINEQLGDKGSIIFQLVNQNMACTVQSDKNTKVIILFSDLVQIIYSASPMRAVAVLAHELGHIYHDHGTNNKSLSTLEMQIEADNFACQLGFARELHDVLTEFQDYDNDTRARITYITSFYFKTLYSN